MCSNPGRAIPKEIKMIAVATLLWRSALTQQSLHNNYLSIFLYVLTPEGDIRRVPRNQVLGVIFFCVCFFFSFCAMLVLLVVSERRASACLIMLSAKQGSHWYHF